MTIDARSDILDGTADLEHSEQQVHHVLSSEAGLEDAGDSIAGPASDHETPSDYETWSRRDLSEADFVYWWVDGVELPWPGSIDADQPGVTTLVILGVRADGSKEPVALVRGDHRSERSWRTLLDDLRQRNLDGPELVVGDPDLGIWDALVAAYGDEVAMQECWTHKTSQVLARLPSGTHRKTRNVIRRIYNSESRSNAYGAAADLIGHLSENPDAGAEVTDNLDRLLTFYDFPRQHWKHIRTSHTVESTFSAIISELAAEPAVSTDRELLASTYERLVTAQTRWRRINSPDLTEVVREGGVFVDGRRRKGNRNQPVLIPEDDPVSSDPKDSASGGPEVTTVAKIVQTLGLLAGVWDQTTTRLRAPVGIGHSLVALTGGLAALAVLPRLTPSELGPLGLASNLGVGFYLALTVLLIGFAFASVRQPKHRILGTYVFVTAVVINALGPIVYEYPRFSWAWKHIGIVDFIQRTGIVDPTIESLRVYQSYPGFFGLGALLTDTAGVSSALAFAAWTPVVLNLLYVATLYVIFRTFTLDERIIWTGLMIFVLGNWVGQDYFAPQAVAFLFYLAVIAILLHWFPMGRRDHDHMATDLEPSVAAGIVFLLLAAMVVTHQLTPVMMMVAAAGLAVFRLTKLKWPLTVTMTLVFTWAVGFARPFFDDYLPKIVRDLSNLGGRIDAGLIDYGQVDLSQRYVSLGSRGLTLLVLALAGLGYLRGFRTGIRWKPAIVLSVTPLILIVASSYGNEILFRTFLFMLPMVAFFVGALWFVREPSRGSRLTVVTLSVALIAMAGLSLVARHGNDVRSVFSHDEVAAATEMYRNAPNGSAVIQLSVSYPTKFMNYERLTELSVSTFSPAAKERFLADPSSVFTEWLRQGGYQAGYVLITRSQAADITRSGALPASAPAEITRDLRTSSDFDILYDSDDAVLFKLAEPR